MLPATAQVALIRPHPRIVPSKGLHEEFLQGRSFFPHLHQPDIPGLQPIEDRVESFAGCGYGTACIFQSASQPLQIRWQGFGRPPVLSGRRSLTLRRDSREPLATTRPALSTLSRSHVASTSENWCELRKIVSPRLFRSSISSSISNWAMGSSPEEGS